MVSPIDFGTVTKQPAPPFRNPKLGPIPQHGTPKPTTQPAAQPAARKYGDVSTRGGVDAETVAMPTLANKRPPSPGGERQNHMTPQRRMVRSNQPAEARTDAAMKLMSPIKTGAPPAKLVGPAAEPDGLPIDLRPMRPGEAPADQVGKIVRSGFPSNEEVAARNAALFPMSGGDAAKKPGGGDWQMPLMLLMPMLAALAAPKKKRGRAIAAAGMQIPAMLMLSRMIGQGAQGAPTGTDVGGEAV